ncbi:hypothetical protein EVG20_g9774 [Dentipellis fragilis]|uniref:DDE-1 domain-containing protein n=1 Tax=Dentipellis fragilis TaxID=205917 RepID=A0A4Y9Y080_9AGAM|nr:hypothetical protein EVG20_g9774 [Dentipellis fragilis]
MKVLKHDQPELFGYLNHGTVHHWFAPGGRGWILKAYPRVVEKITAKLKDLRRSGLPVSVSLARSLILAIIKSEEPDLLKTFKVSEHYVRAFLQSKLDWSRCKGTRAAAHIPENVPEVCEWAFFHAVYLMKEYDIPAKLGKHVLTGNSSTYHEHGAKQVDIVTKDEKCAYTLLVASTPSGSILPFQQVWSGSTHHSLLVGGADGMDEALDRGFHFAFAASMKKTSHFSTLKTMKEWIEEIYVPYMRNVIDGDPDLHDSLNQKSLLILDCYPVHRGEEFQHYMKTNHLDIFVIYVPTNCTGIFQPADVGLQRIIKHRLAQEELHFLVAEHEKQIDNGLMPEQVKITTSYLMLRDATMRPFITIWDFLNGPYGRDIIKKTWKKCVAKEWCLSEDVFTSRKACNALKDYLRSDKQLRDEIEGKVGPLVELEEVMPDELEDDEDEDVDDTNIPMNRVVEDALGISVPGDVELGEFCVHLSDIRERGRGLEMTAEAEDIWMEEELV